MAVSSQRTEDALDVLADRLANDYAHHDPVRSDTIRGLVTAEASRFAHAPVQAFVPILVERAVRDRLGA